ncbi:MAG: sel1 repeat family protein, partial [Arenibacter algicola]|nr:sel1 repeat family protein [Arenibacter algicola]
MALAIMAVSLSFALFHGTGYSRAMIAPLRLCKLAPALLAVAVLLCNGPAMAKSSPRLHRAIDHLEAKEYLQALDLLLPMALYGDEDAQYQIGWMYDHGTGIPMNSCIATLWYDKAARQGHLMAQRSMSFAYHGGDGVEKNHKLAYRWLLHAIREGLDWAARDIDFISMELGPQQKLDVETSMDDWHAAEQPAANVVILPNEAFRSHRLHNEYSDHGFRD